MGRVSYDKDMRDRALSEQGGLVTLEAIAPGKTKGKRGMRIRVQSQINAEDYKKITRFMRRFWTSRKWLAQKHK